MGPHTVLLVCPETGLRESLSASITPLPVHLVAVSSTGEALRALGESDPKIAVVSDTLGQGATAELCDALRKAHRREPFQIVLVVQELEVDFLERSMNGPVDDFHLAGGPGTGLSLRLQAALRRIAAHEVVAEEREFYRRAARQEEELTSRVLDETLALRDKALSGSPQARVDPVTGLLSEQALLEEADREVERAVRSLNTLAGFLVSIDEREQLLRSHGADALDRLLRRVGRAFRHGLRRYDLAGHHGPEAILTLLPGADLSTATAVAERFRGVLARLVAELQGLGGDVSFSFGVALFTGNESRAQWITRAANSLARARSLGGARVETDDRPANAYALWRATRAAPPRT